MGTLAMGWLLATLSGLAGWWLRGRFDAVRSQMERDDQARRERWAIQAARRQGSHG